MHFAVIFICWIGLAASSTLSPQTTNAAASVDLQEYRKVCGTHYSLACLKADVVRLIELFSQTPPVQLLPGISISSTGIRANLKGLSQRTADDILVTAITDFIRSVTIHVSLFNENATAFFGIGRESSHSTSKGRLRRFKFFTIFTIFGIAFALLSALVGKAMSLSIVSLVLGLVARNGGIGNNAPNSAPLIYDVVRRPYIQFANTHSSEEIYEGARTVFPYAQGYSRPFNRGFVAKPYSAYLQQTRSINHLQNVTTEDI